MRESSVLVALLQRVGCFRFPVVSACASDSIVFDSIMSSSLKAPSENPMSSKAASTVKDGDALIRSSLSSYADDFSHGTCVATSAPEVRLGFLRKVYGILAVQIAVTTLIVAIFMEVTPVRNAVLAGRGVLTVVAILGTFGTIFALLFKKDSYPLNMQLLAAFTTMESVLVGTLCAQYAAAGLGYLVLEALVLTLAVFSSLTAYCLLSKKDFSFMGGALTAGLIALIGASLVNLIIGFTGGKSAGLAFVIAWGGATLFSLFILYDTSLLMHHLSPDEYILAAVSLYLDILNLFLHILAILSRGRDN